MAAMLKPNAAASARKVTPGQMHGGMALQPADPSPSQPLVEAAAGTAAAAPSSHVHHEAATATEAGTGAALSRVRHASPHKRSATAAIERPGGATMHPTTLRKSGGGPTPHAAVQARGKSVGGHEWPGMPQPAAWVSPVGSNHGGVAAPPPVADRGHPPQRADDGALPATAAREAEQEDDDPAHALGMMAAAEALGMRTAADEEGGGKASIKQRVSKRAAAAAPPPPPPPPPPPLRQPKPPTMSSGNGGDHAGVGPAAAPVALVAAGRPRRATAELALRRLKGDRDAAPPDLFASKATAVPGSMAVPMAASAQLLPVRTVSVLPQSQARSKAPATPHRLTSQRGVAEPAGPREESGQPKPGRQGRAKGNAVLRSEEAEGDFSMGGGSDALDLLGNAAEIAFSAQTLQAIVSLEPAMQEAAPPARGRGRPPGRTKASGQGHHPATVAGQQQSPGRGRPASAVAHRSPGGKAAKSPASHKGAKAGGGPSKRKRQPADGEQEGDEGRSGDAGADDSRFGGPPFRKTRRLVDIVDPMPTDASPQPLTAVKSPQPAVKAKTPKARPVLASAIAATRSPAAVAAASPPASGRIQPSPLQARRDSGPAAGPVPKAVPAPIPVPAPVPAATAAGSRLVFRLKKPVPRLSDDAALCFAAEAAAAAAGLLPSTEEDALDDDDHDASGSPPPEREAEPYAPQSSPSRPPRGKQLQQQQSPHTAAASLGATVGMRLLSGSPIASSHRPLPTAAVLPRSPLGPRPGDSPPPPYSGGRAALPVHLAPRQDGSRRSSLGGDFEQGLPPSSEGRPRSARPPPQQQQQPQWEGSGLGGTGDPRIHDAGSPGLPKYRAQTPLPQQQHVLQGSARAGAAPAAGGAQAWRSPQQQQQRGTKGVVRTAGQDTVRRLGGAGVVAPKHLFSLTRGTGVILKSRHPPPIAVLQSLSLSRLAVTTRTLKMEVQLLPLPPAAGSAAVVGPLWL